jgi:hypothetical protein
LEERVGTVESSIRMVAAGHQVLHEQMAELTVLVHRQDTQIRADLAENSKVTRETLAAANEIRDLVTTARTGGRLVRWAAPTLASCVVLWGMVSGWLVDFGHAVSAAIGIGKKP